MAAVSRPGHLLGRCASPRCASADARQCAASRRLHLSPCTLSPPRTTAPLPLSSPPPQRHSESEWRSPPAAEPLFAMFPTFAQWAKAAEDAAPSVCEPSGAWTAQPAAAAALPVLVIGAGPAGLAVMAELRRRSVPFVCLEASVGVGGMWDRRNPSSPVYPSLTSNVSRFSMTLAQPFDMPAHWPLYVPHQLVLSYLQSFAEKRELLPSIRFGHRVLHCQYDQDTRCWHVRSARSSAAGEPEAEEVSEDFSDVIACSGQNSQRTAAYPQRLLAEAKAAGLLIRHTAQYVEGEEFRDKRVLVLGLGISGAGVAAMVSKVASRTLVAVRTPQYFIPQWVLGYPTDQMSAGGLPDLTSLPRWLTAPLVWLGRRLLAGVEYLLGSTTHSLGMKRPQHSVLDKTSVVTDGAFAEAVKAGAITVRPEVIAFDQGRALYTNKPDKAVHTSVDSDEIDAVIFATGYDWTFPYLPPDLLPSTQRPADISTGKWPSACYLAPSTLTSTLPMLVFHPSNPQLYFMTELMHVYSAWPIFACQARTIVACLTARRSGSSRAAAFDRLCCSGFPNPSFSGPFLKAEYWKSGDEFYVDKDLYENFLNQFSTWIEERHDNGHSNGLS